MSTRQAGVAVALAFLVVGCSAPSTTTESPAQDTDGTISPSVAELPPDSPGPMEIGSSLSVFEGFPSRDQLEQYLPAHVFDPSIDSAADTAFTFMALVSGSFASTVDEPADVTFIKALSTDDCNWCSAHVELIRDFVNETVRVTGWEYSDSELGEFLYFELEDGSVVVEIPTRVSAVQFWNTDGTLINDQPAYDVLYRIQLRYIDGMWQVVGIAEQPL